MASIQILMGVYDGTAYLPDQLQSLAEQSHGAWQLIASDDSPGPESRAAIERFAADQPNPVRVIEGPRRGFALNYLHLIRHAAPGPLALSDQDDIWQPDKLARAVAALARVPEVQPALYCARVQSWDGQRTWPPLPPLPRSPSFANALIENVATGNTIVLNAAAAALARRFAPQVPALFAHDWWLYQLISGVGGQILHDDGPPVVLYRQHSGNMIGSGRGVAAQMRRKRAVLRGAFAQRLDLNAAALAPAQGVLTPENGALLQKFEAARRRSGPGRLIALGRLGLYRQRATATAGFFAAAALGRV